MVRHRSASKSISLINTQPENSNIKSQNEERAILLFHYKIDNIMIICCFKQRWHYGNKTIQVLNNQSKRFFLIISKTINDNIWLALVG